MDFVILWVDNSDPQWIESYNKYSTLHGGIKKDIYYRDWDILKYWFRGVEKYSPWVDKIHFITCGHYPKWLNLNAKKLNFVRHEDFIPSEYLPTFNAFSIELNIHRIEGLSEEFVYFNDDFFIINKVDENRFFRKGKPCDMAIMNALSGGGISHTTLSGIEVLNKHFNKKDVLKSNIYDFFNLRYGINLFRSIMLLSWPRFTGFLDHHLPQPFLKSIFHEVWDKEYERLDNTCRSKFRELDNVNQYLLRYWQFCTHGFTPYNIQNDSCMYGIYSESIDAIVDIIKHRKKSIIVLNDTDLCNNFDFCKKKIIESFEQIFPDKSSYEL
ncbi:Stealth CR1 domain-containing protein [Parabacteroides gordonii]|jgi:hypothetical protein|uniref:Stealth CR1 domain-containing protein n=1 Tax=Parabacteroides gordonii TaxID=574930 RepID=UPI00242031D5|nr:Stealth CR1 domain-containing protein [Parabacteroides gordonii]